MFLAEGAGLFHRHEHTVTTERAHLRRSYLKATKVSKNEDTRQVEYTNHFCKYDDAVYQKLSKLINAC